MSTVVTKNGEVVTVSQKTPTRVDNGWDFGGFILVHSDDLEFHSVSPNNLPVDVRHRRYLYDGTTFTVAPLTPKQQAKVDKENAKTARRESVKSSIDSVLKKNNVQDDTKLILHILYSIVDGNYQDMRAFKPILKELVEKHTL